MKSSPRTSSKLVDLLDLAEEAVPADIEAEALVLLRTRQAAHRGGLLEDRGPDIEPRQLIGRRQACRPAPITSTRRPSLALAPVEAATVADSAAGTLRSCARRKHEVLPSAVAATAADKDG